MKKRLLILILSLLFTVPAFAVTVPSFITGDRVVLEIEEGSHEEKALLAATNELSEEWFTEWTTGESLLRKAGWKVLDGLFPMEDVIVLEEKDGAVGVYSLKTGVLVSFTFFEDLINAVAVIEL